MDTNEPTFDELLDAFQSSGSPAPFRVTYGDLTSRGVAHIASLVNDGVWSVDQLLLTYDDGLAGGADPAEGRQVLRDVARELNSETDAAKVEQYLEKLQDQSPSSDSAEEGG